MNFSDRQIDLLSKKVEGTLSKKRFIHTLGVEKCAKELGKIFIPESVNELRAAALLHDIAKEFPIEEQIALLKSSSVSLNDEDFTTKGVIHSFCAPLIIKRDFPEFATEKILSAVFNHTVGKPDMSIFDKIIFISDYAEEGRTYPSCKRVRAFLLSGIDSLSLSEQVLRLDEAVLMSVDGALEALTRMGAEINSRMYETRKSLIK